MDGPPPSQRVSRLTPLAEVLERIVAVARPVAAHKIMLARAGGRVLAAAVSPDSAVPPATMALRDGWAVDADLVGDAGPYAPVALDPAPVFVDSGDIIPDNTNAILPPDAVTLRGGSAEAIAAAASGDGCLPAGTDGISGTPLRRAGDRLRDLDIAALQAAGIAQVHVREPRVLVVCVSAREATSDVVGPLLFRAIERAGGIAISHRPATETGVLEQALAAEGVDAFILVGGTGEGRRDMSISTLARVGRVDIHGMALLPGQTAALGVVAQRPVLVLPGRLDAALSVWLAIGAPLLARLTGSREVERAWSVTLGRKIVSTIGLAEIVPIGACEGGFGPLASGYFPLQALTRAAGWVMVPPDSEGYGTGSLVGVMPLP